ncbi:serine/threonine protein kinase [Nocardia brasiliensis]|nr:serine/threonine protein kinase [Nocardia brasiliensis]SUB54731.1 Probable serine/threonine-protein kinase pknH [Nocardia brasiliensis]
MLYQWREKSLPLSCIRKRLAVDRSTAESRVGMQFGHYELRALLGRGGMGEVYEAFDTAKSRAVAVKILPKTLAKDTTFQERFRRESRAAARVQEPHVVPIHDWGEIDGELYIDMRLVRGHSLRTLVGYGPIAPARAVALIEQVAAALDAAHAEALIHRDVKPENILVTSDDFAYLVDFGIACSAADPGLTAAASAIGSYGYMAPERFDDAPVTSRVDVYSLACVLVEILSGERPFPASSVSHVVKAHLISAPPRLSISRPGIPAALDAVVARGMAKDPEARYPTAGDLARAARAALSAPRLDKVTAIDSQEVPTTVGATPAYAATLTRPTSGLGSAAEIIARTGGSAQPAGILYASAPFRVAPLPVSTRRSRAVSIVLGLLLVAVIALGGVVTSLIAVEPETRSGAQPTPNGAPVGSGKHSTVAVPAVPAVVAGDLPPGATPCAPVFGRTGAFTASAAGTTVTSCAFAEEVRRAYAASGPPAPRPRVVVAFSPVTGLTYSMVCTAEAGLVSCSGGKDAVVYVY